MQRERREERRGRFDEVVVGGGAGCGTLEKRGPQKAYIESTARRVKIGPTAQEWEKWRGKKPMFELLSWVRNNGGGFALDNDTLGMALLLGGGVHSTGLRVSTGW